jgi:hypothetical protein
MTGHHEFIGRLLEEDMVDPETGRVPDALFGLERGHEPYVPPFVKLDGDRLLYTWEPHGLRRRDRRRIELGRMLDAFLRIQDGHGVLRFARRYGVLRICEHGLPASHQLLAPVRYEPPLFVPDPEGLWGVAGRTMGSDWLPIALCEPLREGQERFSGLYWDPIDRWLAYAEQARAMLNIGRKLHGKESTTVADWSALGELFPIHPHGITEEVLGKVQRPPWGIRRYLAMAVQGWLQLGGVQPTLNWWADSPAVVLEPSFLDGWTFGALAVQILMLVAQAYALATCDGCGTVYPRTCRPPNPGLRNFCPKCGGERGQGKVAAKLRKRAQRARRQQADNAEGIGDSAAAGQKEG